MSEINAFIVTKGEITKELGNVLKVYEKEKGIGLFINIQYNLSTLLNSIGIEKNFFFVGDNPQYPHTDYLMDLFEFGTDTVYTEKLRVFDEVVDILRKSPDVEAFDFYYSDYCESELEDYKVIIAGKRKLSEIFLDAIEEQYRERGFIANPSGIRVVFQE